MNRLFLRCVDLASLALKALVCLMLIAPVLAATSLADPLRELFRAEIDTEGHAPTVFWRTDTTKLGSLPTFAESAESLDILAVSSNCKNSAFFHISILYT